METLLEIEVNLGKERKKILFLFFVDSKVSPWKELFKFLFLWRCHYWFMMG